MFLLKGYLFAINVALLAFEAREIAVTFTELEGIQRCNPVLLAGGFMGKCV